MLFQDADAAGLVGGDQPHELNKVNFFGLGRESADAVLPESQLYRPEYATPGAA